MLTKLAVDRRAEYRKAWLALGGKVGISEWDYKTYKGPAAGEAPTQQSESATSPASLPAAAAEELHIATTAPGPPQGTPHAEPPNPIESSQAPANHSIPEESTAHPSPTITAVSTNLSRSSSTDSPRMVDGEKNGHGPAGSTLSVISDATLHDGNGQDGNGEADGQLREKMEAVRLVPVIPEGLPVGSARV